MGRVELPRVYDVGRSHHKHFAVTFFRILIQNQQGTAVCRTCRTNALFLMQAQFVLCLFRLQNMLLSMAGRIVKKREQGKLLFYGLKADGANVQVMASLSDYEGGEEEFWKVRTTDIVSVIDSVTEVREGWGLERATRIRAGVHNSKMNRIK